MEEGSVHIRLTETQETLSDREGEYFSNFANESCKCDSSWCATAHARLLADQEDREIEHLVATVMELSSPCLHDLLMWLEKLNSKIKHLGDLELIMEKEHAQMEELEESLQAERMNVLQRVLNAGLSRWRDHTSAGQAMCFNGGFLDEAEEDIEVEVELSEPTLNFETVTLNSTNPNTRSSSPIQLEISDDEFINIPDITPPSPPSIPVSSFRPSDYCPISRILGGLGLRLRSKWLDSCARGLEGLLFTRLDDAVEAVDEIVNISCPLKGRYQNAPSTLRCLKCDMGLLLNLVRNTACQVATCNLNVRHELLMLVLEVLGGLVEELEAARQRLVNELELLLPHGPLILLVFQGHDNSSMQQPTISVQADAQGTTSGVSTSDRTAEDSAVPMSRVSAEGNPSSAGPNPPSAAPVHRESAERNPSSAAPIHREVAEPSPSYAASFNREMDEHNQHNASSSSAVLEVDDIHMAEAVEHLSALTGDLGTPFTYLASLSAESLGTILANDFALSMVASADMKSINNHGKVNGLLTKQDFQRAAYHVCGISLTDNVVDMIIYVFDDNRDRKVAQMSSSRVLQRREGDILQPRDAGVKKIVLLQGYFYDHGHYCFSVT
ncbi:hypothetical protein RJ640_022244 [Escallonia rubra]|uniref:SMARCC C-terminal domain-containing protein n=1 Tax=Escallonia rubra TaxID=112253 RepID=A0AA88U8F4_9ASTE|nr:hypothetical protein RJ640_022244 [Escallonia rubra]